MLRQLYAERKSGILYISRQNIRKRIHLKDGVAIFADAGDGQPLSRDQAEVLAFSLFTWTSGELAFEEGEPEIDEAQAFDGSPSWLILEASRRIDEVEVLEQLLGGPDAVLSCTKTTALPVFTMRLSPAENAILTFARECEQFTAADLPLPAGDVAVLSALNALVAVGLLEIVEKKAASESVLPPTTASTPPPPPQSPVTASVPTEVEALFDTLEASRTGIAQPNPNPSAPSSPEEPPASDAPETTIADDATPEHPAESLDRESSWMGIVNACKDKVVGLVPGGTSRFVAAGSVALVGVAVALVLLLASGDDEGSHSNPIVVADSTPPPEPPRPAPNAEPEPEPEPESSEAELFYQANLAFENGEYEQSKTHLTELLELQPDLTTARELLARVDRELAPKPEPPEPKPAPKRVRDPEPEPEPEPAPKPEPRPPPPPTPAVLFADARAAFNRGELELSQTTLEELNAVDPDYPGAERLERQLSDRFWERKLPLAFSARHDHALGGCDGVLTLTAQGYGYRSDEHEWSWRFQDVAETQRRDAERLRLETREGKSYNFELREPLTDDDWSRYQRLTTR